MEARIPTPPFDKGDSRGLERVSGLLKVTELGAELGQSWDRNPAPGSEPRCHTAEGRRWEAAAAGAGLPEQTSAGPGGRLLGACICDSGVELTVSLGSMMPAGLALLLPLQGVGLLALSRCSSSLQETRK